MSMRVQDLQKWGQVHFSAQAWGWLQGGRYYRKNVPVPAYKHRYAAGPDPVNIVLFASIFILSGFLLYSVVNTMRYVPALETQRGLTPFTGSSVQGAGGREETTGNVAGSDPIYTGSSVQGAGGSEASAAVAAPKPWYEKPPYVRESLLSERIAGYRTFKETAQLKTIQSGILK